MHVVQPQILEIIFIGRIRAATILQAVTSSPRTHLLGYELVNLQFRIRLLQGERSSRFLVILPVTDTLDGD